MKEIKKITVLCAGYPTPADPTMLPFIDQLVCAWADMGVSVNVICPVMRFAEIKDKTRFYKSRWTRKTERGNEFPVCHPRYLGFGALEGKISALYRISYRNFQKAIRRTLDSMSQLPDVLYSHFLTAGTHTGDLSQEYGIPGFCAFGESSLWSVNPGNTDTAKDSLGKLRGIIAVSSGNKETLVHSGLYPAERIRVIPNAVNTDIFHPYDRGEMRRKYGFPENETIGVFVGAFCDRKGVLRVQEAAQNENIRMIYIGGGEEDPAGENILFKGKVPHARIAEYLSAADFFVLPTKAEGCCNAIIEAIACGLPVISSDKRFNDDILSDEYSIRIDPDSTEEIRNAMVYLAENPEKREKMSDAAKDKAAHLSIEERASLIIRAMQELCLCDPDPAEGTTVIPR